ncbi:uncharacterized protein BCR38DRAFT_432402 [Pseudomassariella vexata]|uniref:Uncharacterized protein n=1 Tax=Pseudomassariella vexata TaxID=1141098 RepID=A0A1Y2E1D8_9PEZI|nr:uncharacterized protein BCR38DRAFT_432402 [Pseudomassariella vexata]ORY65299.1 hypothetical protein BCR38DRAFT_432402 [Pseudomassariella vexata]
MPTTSLAPIASTTPIVPVLQAAWHSGDTAVLHPVFFTQRLHRSPFVPLAAAAITSPVAHGYTYSEAQRRSGGGLSSRL